MLPRQCRAFSLFIIAAPATMMYFFDIKKYQKRWGALFLAGGAVILVAAATGLYFLEQCYPKTRGALFLAGKAVIPVTLVTDMYFLTPKSTKNFSAFRFAPGP